jgi:GntR family transcriptional regulator
VLQLKLQTASPIPMYLQIVEQVRRGIAAGMLETDEEMPSVRALASEHLINPNTVARAYLELEREGFLAKRRGAGTYVAPVGASVRHEHRKRIVTELLDQAVAAARQFGWPDEQVHRALEDRLQKNGSEWKR